MRCNANQFPPRPAGLILRGWGFPFALIRRGGEEIGKRPKTALAYIISARSDDGGRTLVMRALIKRGNGWTQPRPLAGRDVVQSWRNEPSPATVAKTRKALKPVERPAL
jgi:hypothetical protein